MSNLIKLREEVNKIDDEIVRLIARRLMIVRDIAALKLRENIRLLNEVREAEVLDRAIRLGSELGVNPEYMELLFRVILLISLREELRLAEELK